MTWPVGAAFGETLADLMGSPPAGLESVPVDGVTTIGDVTTASFEISGVTYVLVLDNVSETLLFKPDVDLALSSLNASLSPFDALQLSAPLFVYAPETAESGSLSLPADAVDVLELASGAIDFAPGLKISAPVIPTPGSDLAALASDLNLNTSSWQLLTTLPADVLGAAEPPLLSLAIDVGNIALPGLTASNAMLSVSNGPDGNGVTADVAVSIGSEAFNIDDVTIAHASGITTLAGTFIPDTPVEVTSSLSIVSAGLSGTFENEEKSMEVSIEIALDGRTVNLFQTFDDAGLVQSGLDGPVTLPALGALFGLSLPSLGFLDSLDAQVVVVSDDSVSASVADDDGNEFDFALFRQPGETSWNFALVGRQSLRLSTFVSALASTPFDDLLIDSPTIIYVDPENDTDGLSLPGIVPAGTASPAEPGVAVAGGATADGSLGDLLVSVGQSGISLPLFLAAPTSFLDNPASPPPLSLDLPIGQDISIGGLIGTGTSLAVSRGGSEGDSAGLSTNVSFDIGGVQIDLDAVSLVRSAGETFVEGSSELPAPITLPFGGIAISSIGISGTIADAGGAAVTISGSGVSGESLISFSQGVGGSEPQTTFSGELSFGQLTGLSLPALDAITVSGIRVSASEIVGDLAIDGQAYTLALFKSAGDNAYNVALKSDLVLDLTTFVADLPASPFGDFGIAAPTIVYIPPDNSTRVTLPAAFSDGFEQDADGTSELGGGVAIRGKPVIAGDLLALLRSVSIPESVIEGLSEVPLAAALPPGFLTNPVSLPDLAFEIPLVEEIDLPGNPAFIDVITTALSIALVNGNASFGLGAVATITTPDNVQEYDALLTTGKDEGGNGFIGLAGTSATTWFDAFSIPGLDIFAPSFELLLGPSSSLRFSGGTNLVPSDDLLVDLSVSLVPGASGKTELGDSQLSLLNADLRLSDIPGLGDAIAPIESLIEALMPGDAPVIRDLEIGGSSSGDKAVAGSISTDGGASYTESLLFQTDGNWNLALFRENATLGDLVPFLYTALDAIPLVGDQLTAPLDAFAFEKYALIFSNEGFDKPVDGLPPVAQAQFRRFYGDDLGQSMNLIKGLGLVSNIDPSDYPTSTTIGQLFDTLQITDELTVAGGIGAGIALSGALPTVQIPAVLSDAVPLPAEFGTSFFINISSAGATYGLAVDLGELEFDLNGDAPGGEIPSLDAVARFQSGTSVGAGLGGTTLVDWNDGLGIVGMTLLAGSSLEFAFGTETSLRVVGKARVGSKEFQVEGDGGVNNGVPFVGLGGAINEITLSELIAIAGATGQFPSARITGILDNASTDDDFVAIELASPGAETTNITGASGGIHVSGALFAVRESPALGTFSGTISDGLKATGRVNDITAGPIRIRPNGFPDNTATQAELDINAPIIPGPFDQPMFRISGAISLDAGVSYQAGFVDLTPSRWEFEFSNKGGPQGFTYTFGAFLDGPESIDFADADLGFSGSLDTQKIIDWIKSDGIEDARAIFSTLTDATTTLQEEKRLADIEIARLGGLITQRADVLAEERKDNIQAIDDRITAVESALAPYQEDLSDLQSKLAGCSSRVCVPDPLDCSIQNFELVCAEICSTVVDPVCAGKYSADIDELIENASLSALLAERAALEAERAALVSFYGATPISSDPLIVSYQVALNVAQATSDAFGEALAAASTFSDNVTAALDSFETAMGFFNLTHAKVLGTLQNALDDKPLIMELRYEVLGENFVTYLAYNPLDPADIERQLRFVVVNALREYSIEGELPAPMQVLLENEYNITAASAQAERDQVAAANGLDLDGGTDVAGQPVVDEPPCEVGCSDSSVAIPPLGAGVTSMVYDEASLFNAVFGEGVVPLEGVDFTRFALGSASGLALTDRYSQEYSIDSPPPLVANRPVENKAGGFELYYDTTGLGDGSCRTFRLDNAFANKYMVYDDNEASGWSGALSVGDINNYENDNIRFRFEDDSTAPTWMAFELVDNSNESGEAFHIVDIEGNKQFVSTENPVNVNVPALDGSGDLVRVALIGVVANYPIREVFFNEGNGGDDVGIRNIYLPGPAFDQDDDGLPDCEEIRIGTNVRDSNSDNDDAIDGVDEFPLDPAASRDTDGDGRPDAFTPGCNLTCQLTSTFTIDDDDDNDGVPDLEDAFPANAAAAVDIDNDGQPDAWLAACDAACQASSGLVLDADLDNDGLDDDAEALLGTNPRDPDSDDDGLPDGSDPYPLIDLQSLSLTDADGDGIPDECDPACRDLGMTQDIDRDGDGLIEIDSLGDLSNIRFNPSTIGCPADICSGYELTRDLDFDTDGDGDLSDEAFWHAGDGWVPIGSVDEPFTGTFDGNGFRIDNLYIDRPGQSGVGLFAATSGATVRDVEFGGGLSLVIGGSTSGVVAGAMTNTVVIDVSVEALLVGENGVGMLAGRASGGSVSGVRALGIVMGAAEVGGLLGEAAGANVTSSLSRGELLADSLVGGLVGRAANANVSQSYFAGAVSGIDSVGGLAGFSDASSWTSVYAYADVSGELDVGGLFGRGEFSTIWYATWIGEVVASEDRAGGFAGDLTTQGKKAAVVRELTVSGEVVSAGTAVGAVIGRHTGGVRDFSDVYYVSGGNYPEVGETSQANNEYSSRIEGYPASELEVVNQADPYHGGWNLGEWDFGAATPQLPALMFGAQSMRDSDGDGIPDFEDALVNDPSNGVTTRPSTDIDRDGIPDDEELDRVGSLNLLGVGNDYDSDGLEDVDELARGTDPADADSDGDGDLDGTEVILGTDPLDPLSNITLLSPGIPTVLAIESPANLAGNLWDSTVFDDEPNRWLAASGWQIGLQDDFSADALIFDREIIGDIGDETVGRQLAVPDGVLAPATGYWVRTIHENDLGYWSPDWSPPLMFQTAVADNADSDGNGLPDALEIDGFVDSNFNGVDDADEGIVALYEPYLSYPLGVRVDAGTVSRLAVTGSGSLPPSLQPNEPISLYEVRITGLAVAETPASVVLEVFFPWSFPATVSWLTYDAPGASLEAFADGMVAGRAAEIILTDGAIGDADGVVNGTIVHSGGPGVSNVAFVVDTDADGFDDLVDACPGFDDAVVSPLAFVGGDIELIDSTGEGMAVDFVAMFTGGCDETTVAPQRKVYSIGSYTETVTATNSVESLIETVSVTILDGVAPEVTVPDDFLVLPMFQAGAIVPFTVTASDNADPGPLVTCDRPSGSQFPIGETTVTCTATDAAGNVSAPASFVVTVGDQTPPTISMPADITVEATSPSGTNVSFSVTVEDNLDTGLVANCTPASGSVFPIGKTTVTCSASDAAGNDAQSTFAVDVVDTVAPDLVMPADLDIEGNTFGGADVTLPAIEVTDIADSSPDVFCDATSGFFPLGRTTVECMATDASGNASAGTYVVTVLDTTAPVLSLPGNQTFEGNAIGGATLSADDVAPATASDIVDASPVVTCTPLTGYFPLGATPVTCTATDASGNVSVETFVVTVADTIAPVLSLPGNQTFEGNTAGGAKLSGGDVEPATASDIVDASPAVSCNPLTGYFTLGSTPVECTATDASGNVSTGVFTVSVVDTTPPELALPDDQTFEGDTTGGADLLEGEVVIATATDIVDASPAVDCGTLATFFPLGSTTVDCTATDADGNVSTGSFVVTVEDRTPPDLLLPEDQTFEGNTTRGADLLDGQVVTATATDIVDASPAVDCGTLATFFPLGSTTVDCTATDADGNVSTGSFVVTVEDRTPPDLMLPGNQQIEGNRIGGANVLAGEVTGATATDIVDANPLVNCSPLTGPFDLGTTPVECTATDADGNTTTGTFTVTVVDSTPPRLILPADQIIEGNRFGGATLVAGDVPVATATDIVDASPTAGCTPITGDFPLGTTVVTCTATDFEGNTSEGSFTVTVIDTTPPVLSLPADQTFEGNTIGGANLDQFDVDVTDAIATDIVDEAPSVACAPLTGFFHLGENPVACTATDESGNASAGTFTVTINDTTAPELTASLGLDTLSPPNHTHWQIPIDVIGSDIVDDALSYVATVVSSEPDDGRGDGETTGDIRVELAGGGMLESSNEAPVVTFDPSVDTLLLVAERSGAGDGRIYTIDVTVTDDSGNATAARLFVTVPHSSGESEGGSRGGGNGKRGRGR